MKSYQQLFAELKRRKVFKVAAVYGGVAFVLLQVADLLGEGLRLPDTFLPFVTAVVLVGFPLALILAWAFEVTPEGVHRTAAAAPGEIEGIVAGPAAQRWPAGLLAAAGVLALLAGVWWAGRQSVSAGPPADGRAAEVQLAYEDPIDDGRPSIAVLPFVNMSADPDQEYFSDGMTEEILNTLAKIHELRVAGRTSAFAYKGESIDLRRIGSELGVQYLIEGSVRKAGEQVRITAQLIDVSDGSHVWSDQYDRPLEDVFAIQTEIAESIADELRVPLGLGADERLVSPTADLAAYDLYLAGRNEMRRRGDGLLEAVRLFEAAIARDSAWAPAWAALAEASEISLWYPERFGVASAEEDSLFVRRSLARAEEAARRALALDPTNASALVAMGSVLRDRKQTDEAEGYYLRALEVDPDNPEAHQQYGELLYESGRVAEGVLALDRATAVDPAAIRLSNLAFALEIDDRLDEALSLSELVIERDPDVDIPQAWGGALVHFFRAGRVDDAIAVARKLVRDGPPPPPFWDGLPSEEAVAQGLRALSEGRLEDVPDEVRDMIAPDLWMHLGEEEQAVQQIERWMDRTGARSWAPDYWLPAWDPVRDDPDFQRIFEDEGVVGSELRRTPIDERVLPHVLRGLDERDAP